jgi:hypothetical protein
VFIFTAGCDDMGYSNSMAGTVSADFEPPPCSIIVSDQTTGSHPSWQQEIPEALTNSAAAGRQASRHFFIINQDMAHRGA